MLTRVCLTAVVAAACFAAAPAGPPVPAAPADSLLPEPPAPTGKRPATNEEFAAALKADPIAAFEAVLARCRAEVRGFTCVMQKQERLQGKLGPVEVVDVAFRAEPYSVFMAWRPPFAFGKPVKTLYVRGENGGNTLARLRIGITSGVSPTSDQARAAARFTIEEFGFYYTTLRTHRAWKAARDRGRFRYEFVETRPVPECGGRTCHVIRRACDPPEVDNFSLADQGVKDPARHPDEAFTTVTLMFDAETWLQVGSVVTDAKGQLVGAYYFRDVKLNPTFPPGQFTPSALR